MAKDMVSQRFAKRCLHGMVKMIDREKVIAAEVMSREEACVEMEYTDHDFYVFRDSDRDDTLSILYKRKEKGYGLLVVDEPF